MKKCIISAAFTTCLALWAAVSPRTTTSRKRPVSLDTRRNR